MCVCMIMLISKFLVTLLHFSFVTFFLFTPFVHDNNTLLNIVLLLQV